MSSVSPEVTAAIAACLYEILQTGDDDVSMEMLAAIAAACVHAKIGEKPVLALRFKRQSSAWTTVGRQKVMDRRQLTH